MKLHSQDRRHDGVRGGLRRRRSRAAEGPDQRRRRDVPVPDLLEVVLRVQQAAPERGDQLPVDRVGRRHPPDHQRHGVLRRHRRPDDQRPAAGRAGEDPALPDGARRRRAGLQHPERERRAEVHRSGARRHLPRQDHQVERSGDREAEPRREPAGDRHHGRPSIRRLGHDLHLGGLPGQGVARVEEQGRRRHGGQLAGRPRRQGQRGRGRARHADARLDRLRRADLRPAEQDQLRHRCRTWRASS